MNFELAIKSKRIFTPEGMLEGAVLIHHGKIVAFTGKNLDSAENVIDAGNHVLMPGLIDPHVHINEPGRTEWEGFETATKAAAAGGITTLIDMPLNSTPVTTTFANLQIKIASSRSGLHVNCGFWGGVVQNNLNKLEDLLQGGVFGLKAFLTHSGIDDFPETKPSDLKEVLLLLKKYDLPLLVHCELSENHPGLVYLKRNPCSYEAYLHSRPRAWENKAIEAMIGLCGETGARVHIVHLSSSDAIPMIRKARKEGLPLTVETAPHYLFFHAEEIEDNNTLLKCAPPIREKENNEKLWEALQEGVIDFIATDHSPAPPEIKEIESGNFEQAWGGIAGLQFSLPAVWTAGKKFGITFDDVVKWMSVNPSYFLRLDSSKGKIREGYDADLFIWSPEEETITYTRDIHHRHKQSPYAGKLLTGVVHQTFVKGEMVFNENHFTRLNAGRILLHNSDNKNKK